MDYTKYTSGKHSIYSKSMEQEIDSFKTELEDEKNYRDSVSWSNAEVENNIKKVEVELEKEDYPTEFDEDIAKEKLRNAQLVEGNNILRDQFPLLKEKIKNAKICGPDCRLKHDDLNINLDLLSQSDLVKAVKKFERSKTDLISILRSKEWRLDSESKLHLRLFDQRTYLQNELLLYENSLMRMQKDRNRRNLDLLSEELPFIGESDFTCYTDEDTPCSKDYCSLDVLYSSPNCSQY